MSEAGVSLLPVSPKKLEKRIGVGQEALAPIVEDWIQNAEEKLLIILVANDRQAERLSADLEYFHQQIRGPKTEVRKPDSEVKGQKSEDTLHQPNSVDSATFSYLPEQRLDSEDSSELFEISSDRLSILSQIRNIPFHTPHSKFIISTTPLALSQTVPKPQSLADNELPLATGQTLDFAQFIETLEKLEYDCEDLCEAPGQFAKRGGLVDVYPITADKPYRIDFFGDEIDAIKELDPVTQRSGQGVDAISIAASPTLQLEPAANGILDHLPADLAWGLVEPDEVFDSITSAAELGAENDLGKFWIQLSQTRGSTDSWTTFSDIDLESETGEEVTYEAESLAFYRTPPDETKLADERLEYEQAARIRFLDQLAKWSDQNEQILFILPNESDEKRISAMLKEHKSFDKVSPIFWTGDINQGFRIRFRKNLGQLDWPLLKGKDGAVFVTETELFGRRRHRKPPVRKKALVSQSQVDQLLDFAELVEGEFVVHLQHGIAVYRGITKVEIRGEEREVLSLEFEDKMMLHVPLQESHLISRYVGLSKTRPKLGKLGSNRWSKTREAAERSTLDLAAQLLEIQAKSDLEKGHPFAPDTEWQVEFENTFPFKETPDQLTAIEAAKSDMEQTKPMDRLVCGDVGYGKTEVAIRAAFKAVMDGKQVALLVPTTVLAQQHFINFRDRMAGYPIVVELASRFRKPAEVKKILQALKQRKVDILIGTHRLLQKDVAFADLGLVIIDEEQRFGVKHKEVFKEWRQTVDILTLSATPIPRTLYMALTGARELSTIETPPLERKPIQTVVKGYDDKLVTEVIKREIARGGQVFYLHNRVQTIEATAAHLSELMPKVSIGVGHGQMDERTLERVMTDFVDGRYQVLVCTTIIESGLDIPNCNTIIIEGADRFGLSQLYQLRGRVGRFKRQAYAYLLLHKHKRIMDVARKRLNALRQHNQLGAGFRIAMRDLELRGAGNLLGSQQSGHIVGIGFELYCQLLKQSISRLKGEEVAQLVRASLKLDFVYQGEGQLETSTSSDTGFQVLHRLDLKEDACEPIQAAIPPSYLSETRLRIDMYRRLAMCDEPEKVKAIAEDLQDRFGEYPKEVDALLRLTEVRCLAEQKGVTSVESQGNRLKCRMKPGSVDEFIKVGTRFPRFKSNNALKRLSEIIVVLRNYRPR
ncbi:MAG: transcription-repair coupling factor [Verrucomicrobiota bacterium]